MTVSAESNGRIGLVRPVVQAEPDWRIQGADSVMYRVAGRPLVRGDRVCIAVTDAWGNPKAPAVFPRNASALMLTPEEQVRLVEAEFGIVTQWIGGSD